MTARNVTRCYVVCDTCGRERFGLAVDATSARIEASAEGWKFIAYGRRIQGPKGHKQSGPRNWDACPECPLPPTPEEAERIRNEQEAE